MDGANILLVDDQPANLLALEAILAPLGHPVVSVTSGGAALKQLLLRDFAVILMDARMPILDGYATADLIRQRERSAHTPIIFLTADASDREDMLRAYDKGAVDFLAKPFEPKILRAKVGIFVSLCLQSRKIEHDGDSRRAAEKQARALAEVSAELVRSNRELEQVAYGASHDLKSPLRGISTVCDWIEEDLAGVMTDDTRTHLGQLRSRVRRMIAIVDGILAFARVGQKLAQPERVDIGVLVHGVRELVHVPDGATIDIAACMPVVWVQRQLLEQVFSNLIGNALKYARRADARVSVGVAERGEFLEFWVTDNGPGIAARHHERIWNLFQRLESQDEIEGSGVGLALVKKIVEGQGGRAWVESQPDQGATFRFLWPAGLAGLAGSATDLPNGAALERAPCAP